MNNPNYPIVTIISVQYGQMDVTAEMLESLLHITYPNIEIILIDNASPDCDAKLLKRRFPSITLIENPINVGFAAANNLGIVIAKGKYVLLLNNDTIVEPEFLEPLVNKLESNTKIGAVSPKIRFFSSPNTIQYAGMTPMNNYTIKNQSIGYGKKDIRQYDEDRRTSFAYGTAMMVPVSVINEVGLLPEIYFLYYEELDWGLSIQKAGYEIHYVHNSLIYHKESVTTGEFSPLKTYYLTRSRLIFMRRNFHGLKFILSLGYLIFISVPKNIFSRITKGEFKLLSSYCKALGWHIKNISNSDILSNKNILNS